LSLKASTPVRLRGAVGVNVTLAPQLDPGLRGVGVRQLLVSAKSPLRVTPLMVSGSAPVFVSVTLWAGLVVPRFWLAKVRLPIESVTAGVTPLPLKVIVRGLPSALSVRLSDPLRAPRALGENVTLMTQLPPPATLGRQSLVSPKSLLGTHGLVDVQVAIFVTDRSALPMLRSVTDRGALVAPTLSSGNVRLVLLKLTADPGAGAILATKALVPEGGAGWKPPARVGKSVELAVPAT
jgi:hypothetical protein